MTQPQAITRQQLRNYQIRIKNAGSLAQQKATAIAVYQELYDKGYHYAGWALGVANGKTITGTAALDYLTGTALMGLDSQVCRHLSAEQIDKIRVEMASATLAQMIGAARDTGDVLTQDLKFKHVSDAHKDVFESNGLSLSNWTMHTPMSVYRQAYGDAATEQLWVRIRDTGGDGVDGVSVSTGLVVAMEFLVATNRNADLRKQAQAWMDRVPGVTNSEARTRSTALAFKWLGVDTGSTMKITPAKPDDAIVILEGDKKILEGLAKHLQNQAAQAGKNTPPPTGLGTANRNSATFINSTGAHTIQFKAGGGVDDLWVVENKAGRYHGTREQFRADFVASNSHVNTKTLSVIQGQTYYVPERLANGSTTHHYRSGATMKKNINNGEYQMVLPNTDGTGQTVYSLTAHGTGYTVKQVQTNATGAVVSEYQGQQSTLDGPLRPLSVSSTANNQTTKRNWLTDNVYQTHIYGANNNTPISSSLNFGPINYSLADFSQRSTAEYRLHQLKQSGGLWHNSWDNFTRSTALLHNSNLSYTKP